METSQIIPVNKFKIKPLVYIKSLKSEWDKYILINDKPKAVLVDINRYNKLLKIAKKNKEDYCIDDKNIVWSINKVFWRNEKEYTFW